MNYKVKTNSLFNNCRLLVISALFLLFYTYSYAQDVDAGDNDTICAVSYDLDATNPGGGTGSWSVKVGFGTGTFSDPTYYRANVSEMGFGPNVYIWTVTKNGKTDSDEVTIANFRSYAGEDMAFCGDPATDALTLNAGDPATVPASWGPATGAWSVVEGSANFDDNTKYNTQVTNMVAGGGGVLVLRWTLTIPGAPDAACQSSVDEIVVSFIGGLNTYNVGGGGQYCAGTAGNSVTLDGSEPGVTYELYDVSSGYPGAATGDIKTGTGFALTWTAVTNGTYTVKAYTSSCPATNMTGDVVVSQFPLLNDYNFQSVSSDYFCTGGTGTSLQLLSSDIGVDYQLIRNDSILFGSPIAGNGEILTWSGIDTEGTYSVLADNGTCQQLMTNTVDVQESAPPTIFNLTGSGITCYGEGFIDLDNSENGVNYMLKKSGVDVQEKPGNGTPLQWTNLIPGSYSVIATNALTGCQSTMNNTVNLTSHPQITAYTLTGTDTYCESSGGVTLTLSGSQNTIDYQLYVGGSPDATELSQAGTGGVLTWANKEQGVYTVIATDGGTGCTKQMSGTATVTEQALPQVFTLSAAKSYFCQGSSTTLTLSGSEATAKYILYRDGSAVGLKNGTGAALNWTVGTAGTYTVEARDLANDCPKNMIGNIAITQKALPLANAGVDVTICEGSTTQLNASGGIAYTWTPAATLNDDLIADPIASPTSTTSYTVTVEDIFGCQATDDVNVTVSAIPNGYAGTDLSICEEEIVTLVAEGGGTYAWSTGDNTPSITVSPTTNSTYYVTVTNPAGCINKDTVNIEVRPKPTVNAGGDKSICLGSNQLLTATSPDVVTYLWSTGAATQSITVSPIDTTSYSVVATNAQLCTDTAYVAVNILPVPSASISPNASICIGGSHTFTGTAAGGTAPYTYSWDNGDLTNTTTVSPVANDSYVLTVTDNNNCTDTETASIIVNPLPTLEIVNLPDTLCSNEAAVGFQGTPGGATSVFTGTGVIDLSNGNASFDPSAVLPGTTYNVSYEYTDGNGCYNTTDTSVYVSNETVPTPTFDNLNSVYCESDATIYTITASPAGGTFTGDLAGSPSVALQPSTFGIGSYSTTYTYTNASGCTGTSTANFSIGLPISVDVNSSYCESVTSFNLTVTKTVPDTGLFKVYERTMVDTTLLYSADEYSAQAKFDPSTIGVGNYIITYELSNTAGCSNNDSVDVTVYPLPDATFTLDGSINSTVDLEYCSNNGLVNLVGDPNPGGIFSGTGVTGNKFNPSGISGFTKIYYQYTDGNSCAALDSATVNVKTAPSITIPGLATDYCNDITQFTISANPLGGTWTDPFGDPTVFNDNGDGTAEFNPSNVLAEGGYTLTYEVTGGNGCTSTENRTVNVNFTPTVTFTGLPAEICENASAITLVGNPEDANGVFSGPGVTDNLNGTASFDPNGLAAVNQTVWYKYDTGTCKDSVSKVVLVKSAPEKFSVTGGGAYCEDGGGVAVGLSNSAVGVDYDLILNGSLVVINDEPGTGAALNFGNQLTVGTYTVEATDPASACSETMLGSASVSIDPLPDDAQPITGNTTVCIGGTSQFVVPVINNASSYVWTIPANATIVSGAGTDTILVDFTGVASGAATISVHGNNACGNGNSATLNINVSDVPAAAGVIAGNATVCRLDSSVSYKVPAIAGATSYQWTVPSGASITSGNGTNEILVKYSASALSDDITVAGVNACGTGVSSSLAITVNPLPNISIDPVTDKIDCSGANITLLGNSTTAGATYNWVAIEGGHIASGAGTANPDVDAAGKYVLTVTANGCTIRDTAQVLDDFTVPNAQILPASTLTCTNTEVDITGTTTTPAPLSYLWTTATGNIVSGANTLVATVDQPGVYKLRITDLDNSCFTEKSITIIQEANAPEVSVDPNPSDLTCVTSQVNISGSSTTAGVSYLWTGPGNIDDPTNTATLVDAAGNYTLTVTAPNGCVNSAIVAVAENTTAPNLPTFNAFTDITCAQPEIDIVANSTTAGVTYSWTSASGTGIVAGTNNATVTVDEATDYTVTVTDPVNGCTISRTATINEETTAPGASITGGPFEITCGTPILTLNGNSPTAGVDYSWTVSGGGHILAGQENNQNPQVDKAGNYTLTVTDPVNGCTSTATSPVSSNKIAPDILINAPSTEITCDNTTITLEGSSSVAGVSYSWTASAGGHIVSGANDFNPVVDSAGTYTLVITDPANGCTATASQIITEDLAKPAISLNTNPNDLTCARTEVLLSGSSSTPNVTYAWSGPGGITNPNGQTTFVDGVGTYTFTVHSNDNGCEVQSTVDVAQDLSTSDISINDPDTLTCAVTQVQVTAISSIPATTFTWDAGALGNIISGINTETITVDQAASYKVYATHPTTGCVNSLQKTVEELYTAPSANITGGPYVLTCNTTSLTLNGSTSTGINPVWSTANGNIVSGVNTFSPVVNKIGTYTLTVTNSISGCTDQTSVVVTENKTKPTIAIDPGTFDITCADPNEILGATVSAGAAIVWTGPGNITNGTTENPTVDASGTYTITATNANGCSANETVFVENNTGTPNISVDTNPDDISCENTTVQLSGNSTTSGVSYLWSTGGAGNITNPTTKTPTVDASGVYILTVTAANGCSSASNVTVNQNFDVPVIVNVVNPAAEVITCSDTSVILSGESSTIGATLKWTSAIPGAIIENSSTSSPTVNKSGTYTLTATHPTSGCTATSTVDVLNDLSVPTVNIAAVAQDITCAVTNINLDGSATVDGINYIWTSPDGGTILANGNTAVATVGSAGTYVLTAEHPITGCTADASVVVAEDAGVPDISVDPFPNEITCNVNSVTLSGSSATANTSLIWTTSDGNITSAANINNPTVNESGTYTLTVTNNITGCTATRNVVVANDTITPALTMDPVDVLTCSTTEVVLGATATGVSFAWSTADGTIKNGIDDIANPTATDPGTYEVIITNPTNGCTNTGSVVVSENVDVPDLTVDKTPDEVTCSAPLVTLSAASLTPNVSYSWTAAGTGNLTNPNSASPKVDAADTYTVVVTDQNNGCTISDFVSVTENTTIPDITIVNTTPDTLTCSVSEVLIQGTSTVGTLNYSWTTINGGNIAIPTAKDTYVDAPGLYTLTITNYNNGCVNSADVTVVENITPLSKPVVAAAENCFGEPTSTLSAVGSNIKWYSDASLALDKLVATGNSFTSTESAVGTYSYYVTQTGANGCESASSKVDLVINSLPSKPTLANAEICVGALNPAMTALGNAGNTIKWYDAPGGILLSTGASYTSVEAAVGTYNYYVTQTDANGCESQEAVQIFTINELPASPVVDNAAKSVCYGSDNPAFVATGDNILWYADNPPTVSLSNENSFIPGDISVGTYNYYATETNAKGCESLPTSVELTINSLPSKFNMSGGGSYCEGTGGLPLQIDGSELGVTYQLIRNSTSVRQTVVGDGNPITYANQTLEGVYTVKASDANTCYVNMTGSESILVDSLPAAAGAITGTASICQGSSDMVFEVPIIEYATSYDWVLPVGATIVSGNNSNKIWVDFDNTAVSGNITVTGQNACGDGLESLAFPISVNPLPGAAGIITGPANVCKGDSVFFEVPAITNATSYIWSLPFGMQIINGENTRRIEVFIASNSVSGNLSVAGKNACGLGAVSINHYVSVGLVPLVWAGEDNGICGYDGSFEGAVLDFSGPTINSWTILEGSANISDPTNPMSVFTNLSSGENIFVLTASNGLCASSDTVKLTNNFTEGVSAGVNITVCEDSAVLSGTEPPAETSGLWSFISGGGSFANSVSYSTTVRNLNKGSNMIKWAINKGGCESPAFITITNNSPSEPYAGIDQNICADSTILNADEPTYGTGNWSVIQGAATFENPADWNTKITSVAKGENILRWTISEGGCSRYDDVKIINNKIAVNAGEDQVICSRIADLSATAPASGEGEWSLVSGSALFIDNNDPTTKVSGLLEGDNVLQWEVTNNGCTSQDYVTITNNSPTTADAGADTSIIVNDIQMYGNDPTRGTGLWTIISGGGQIQEPDNHVSLVTNINQGDNVFRWTITYQGCTSFDEVIINNKTPGTTNAGPDQVICRTETSLEANEPQLGYGVWSVIKGSGIFADNELYNTEVTNIAKGENLYLWTVYENGVTTDTVRVLNNTPTASNAGENQVLCVDSVLLAGNNISIGEGTWSIVAGAGDFEDVNKYNSKVTGLGSGQNIFRWTVNNFGCSSEDDVIITNDKPTEAYAGNDQTICESNTVLYANTPAEGVGEWSVLSGSATITGNQVTNLARGENILRYTITNNSCSSYDDIIIKNNKPTLANAGGDKTACTDTFLLAANEIVYGSPKWTVVSGSGTFDNDTLPNTVISGLSSGLNILRWTVENEGCVSFDEIEISYDLIEAIAGDDQTLCADFTTLEANNGDPGYGFWTVVGGSGTATFEDFEQANTNVTDLDRGTNILRWTIEYNGCVSTDEVNIINDKPSDPFAGGDQDICRDSTFLSASDPLVGAGSWQILNGSAVIDNDTDPDTKVTELGYGPNTFRYTVVNGSCSLSDEVVISNNSTVDANAGVDQDVCGSETIVYANNPPFGEGEWTVIGGAATFEDASSFTTNVTALQQGLNTLRWTIANENCSSSDEVIITNNMPSVPTAGADQTICVDTIKLFANQPTIGTGEWSIVSGSGQFEPADSFITVIRGLSPGDNILRWTITNNDCSLSDKVTITNDLPTISNAGLDQHVCGDSAYLYANNVLKGEGRWEVVSGNGDFNNNEMFETLVRNLGYGANTLRWVTTHNLCSTQDEVIVYNDKAEVFAGLDQVVYAPNANLLGNEPDEGATGTWSITAGSGTIANANNYSASVSGLGQGVNTLRWTITTNNCDSYDDVIIKYNVLPKTNFSISSISGCPPFEVELTNNTIGGEPYTWSFGDGQFSNEFNASYTYNNSGRFKLTLTATGPDGEQVQKDTLVTVFEPSLADFNIAPAVVYIPEQAVHFYNLSINAENYLWNFGDGNTSQEINPVHEYADTGKFNIALIAISADGCVDTLIIEDGVQAIQSGTIVFPNAFTPNPGGPNGGVIDENDYSNDVFYPIIEGVEEYHFEIFNRWGILIFETTDPNIGWDGYYKNELLNEGVYVWRVYGRYNNGKSFNEAGTFMLMRTER